MKERTQDGMFEALHLTRAGKLVEATATIQRMLGGASASQTSTVETGGDAPIEAEYHIVEESPTPLKPTVENTPSRTGLFTKDKTKPRTVMPGVLSSKGLRLPKIGPVIEADRTLDPDSPSSLVQVSGQFVDGTYKNKTGIRHYKLYIPGGYTGQAIPLLIMLHGCTQNAIDFAAGTRMNMLAEERSFLVAYPEQLSRANGSKCWNWFQVAHQQRGTGEPSLIAGITHQIMHKYNVDIDRVYIAGLSSGGAMAVIMAATYPDLYAAAGVHSGLAYAAAHDLRSALSAMKQGAAQYTDGLAETIPLILFHGDRDTTVAPINADQLADQWIGAPRVPSVNLKDVTVERGQEAGGQSCTRFIYQDAGGRTILEKWIVHQAGHAWSGGSPGGTFTDPRGPDASAEMVRFFHEHPRKR